MLNVSRVDWRECYFSRLPSELKLEIINYLDQKRDLYNVSKSCQWLEAVALKRLYNVIDVELPTEKNAAWNTGGYLRLRPHVVNVIEELTIRDGIMDYTQPKFSKRRRSDASDPEAYAMQVVDEIPQNQLRSFSFMHRTPITTRLLRLLKIKQARSLRHLSCYEMNAPDLIPALLPSNLESLECRSIDNGDTFGRLVHAGRDTLRSLRIGEEKALVERYHTLRTAFWDSTTQPLAAFQNVSSLSEITNLKELALVGLDLRPLVPIDIESALYLAKLQNLTIESCPGSPEFIRTMSSIFTLVQAEVAPERESVPQLRKFCLRYEASPTTLKTALMEFFSSFHGLQVLSLLLENGSMNLRLPQIATNHGRTLEQLTLETRVQPRELLRHDTSRPLGIGGYTQQLWEEGTDDLCRLCPNLTELSIGFPWNDELVRVRPSALLKLTNLRTMHIRNFPESSTLLQMGDHTIKEYARRFLDWTFGKVEDEMVPQLETLSIGPAVYESRFKGSNPSRRQTPEFLRTHHFAVDWAKTRFGRWSAMVSPVSEKYMEEIRDQKPLGGVFQQVWLK